MDSAVTHSSCSPCKPEELHIHFRQHSFTFRDNSLVHLSQQCFVDYIWILITEDDTCAPGVILRHDPHETGPIARWGEEKALPSVTCECLLGVRDHPLTSVVAGVLAHAVQTSGEDRPLLMCISLTKTAKRLENAPERVAFVQMLRDEMMMLLMGEK